MDTWQIGIDAWIIQDGNYPDFSAGQEAEFAVEFYPEERLAIADQPTSRSAEHRKDSLYSVVGQTCYDDDGPLVIDFGFSAFCEHPQQHFPTGTTVVGELNLGIDPFFYFERLAKLPGMLPLVYTWTIHRIQTQTAPFVRSGKVLSRDKSQWSWQEVARTDAWHDDGGNGSYLLECELHQVDPKFTSATAN